MKILIATDGSQFGDAAVREVAAEPWPAGTQVRLLFALELFPRHTSGEALLPAARCAELEALERERARAFLDEAAAVLRAGALRDFDVETRVALGSPKDVIVKEASRWGADLVILGSHGDGLWQRLLLGSVSSAVAPRLPCSVRIVRPRRDWASTQERTDRRVAP